MDRNFLYLVFISENEREPLNLARSSGSNDREILFAMIFLRELAILSCCVSVTAEKRCKPEQPIFAWILKI